MKHVPHGNAHSGIPYVQTMPSMIYVLKEKAKGSTPKCALKFLSTEAGGILEASSAGSLPRNRQQVKDARQKNTSRQDFDPLYAVMYMCKEAEGKNVKITLYEWSMHHPFQ